MNSKYHKSLFIATVTGILQIIGIAVILFTTSKSYLYDNSNSNDICNWNKIYIIMDSVINFIQNYSKLYTIKRFKHVKFAVNTLYYISTKHLSYNTK